MIVALALVFGCEQQTPAAGTGTVANAASGIYIKFPYAPATMGVEEALHRLELGAKEYTNDRIVGIIEPKPNYDSSGMYSVAVAYGSLAEFIADMNSQVAKYHWESRAGSGYILVFVYPTSGSYLAKTAGPLSISGLDACAVLEKLTSIVDTRSGHGACVVRGNFHTLTNDEFEAIRTKQYSLSVPSGATGLDVVETMIGKIGSPVGFRVGSPFGTGRIHWVIR